MSKKKQIVLRLALVLLGVLACLELAHLGDIMVNEVSHNTEAILRRTPAAAITQEEQTLLETLAGLPSVAEALEGGEGKDLFPSSPEDPALSEALGGFDSCALSVLPGNGTPELILTLRPSEKEQTVLTRVERDQGAEYFKMYARRSFLGTRFLYENRGNREVRQLWVHHFWFSWLVG